MIGRVVLNVPYGGFLLKLLSVPSGVALVICLAGLLVAGTWFVETLEVERRRWPRPGSRPIGEQAATTSSDPAAPLPAAPPTRPLRRPSRREHAPAAGGEERS